jgi:hypothetical protein
LRELAESYTPPLAIDALELNSAIAASVSGHTRHYYAFAECALFRFGWFAE